MTYPAAAYARIQQHVWVLDGTLELSEGPLTHVLGAGDGLRLGPATDCTFGCPGDAPTRYLVVTAPR